MRDGTTLTELVVVLALIGILAFIARPAFGGLYDRSSVLSATSELVALLATARQLAITEGRIVAVRFDQTTGRVVVFADRDTFHLRSLHDTHGTRLIASRDSIASVRISRVTAPLAWTIWPSCWPASGKAARRKAT